MREKNKDGFIIDFWERIFRFLSKISLFYWIRKLSKNYTYTFVDKWVLGNLCFAFLSTLIIYIFVSKYNVINTVLMIYGILRVFEIIVYQLNVLFFDAYRAKKIGRKYKIKSPTRMVLLLLHNYFEVMIWYSVILMSIIQLSGNVLVYSWWSYVRSNILNVATFNSGNIQEITGGFYSNLSDFVFVENITGIIMTIVCLARFINLMPSIDSIEE